MWATLDIRKLIVRSVSQLFHHELVPLSIEVVRDCEEVGLLNDGPVAAIVAEMEVSGVYVCPT